MSHLATSIQSHYMHRYTRQIKCWSIGLPSSTCTNLPMIPSFGYLHRGNTRPLLAYDDILGDEPFGYLHTNALHACMHAWLTLIRSSTNWLPTERYIQHIPALHLLVIQPFGYLKRQKRGIPLSCSHRLDQLPFGYFHTNTHTLTHHTPSVINWLLAQIHSSHIPFIH